MTLVARPDGKVLKILFQFIFSVWKVVFEVTNAKYGRQAENIGISRKVKQDYVTLPFVNIGDLEVLPGCEKSEIQSSNFYNLDFYDWNVFYCIFAQIKNLA